VVLSVARCVMLGRQTHTAVNKLYTLSSCSNFASFTVCHLKRSFTLSLDAINNHNWSFHFFLSSTVDDPILHAPINSH
jgi:hypothetical protein